MRDSNHESHLASTTRLNRMLSTRSQQQRLKQGASSATGGTLRLTAAVVAAVLLLVLFLVPRAQGFHAPTMRVSAGQDRCGLLGDCVVSALCVGRCCADLT